MVTNHPLHVRHRMASKGPEVTASAGTIGCGYKDSSSKPTAPFETSPGSTHPIISVPSCNQTHSSTRDAKSCLWTHCTLEPPEITATTRTYRLCTRSPWCTTYTHHKQPDVGSPSPIPLAPIFSGQMSFHFNITFFL